MLLHYVFTLHIPPKIHQYQHREYRYFFNGQEADNEVFGEVANFGYEFRQYDSRLGRWWGVDLEWKKSPDISPFIFCANIPIIMVDLEGREAWKPDKKGHLIAQENDNFKTLSTFMNISTRKAKKLLSGFNGDVSFGDKLELFNNLSASIAHEGGLSEEQVTDMMDNMFMSGMDEPEVLDAIKKLASPNDYYNCWSAAVAGVNGQTLGPEIYTIATPERFKKSLSNFVQVSPDKAKFGKTIIAFMKDGEYTHAAVYYGTDNEGNVYVYTKNGPYSKPVIMTLEALQQQYENIYGTVSGYYN